LSFRAGSPPPGISVELAHNLAPDADDLAADRRLPGRFGSHLLYESVQAHAARDFHNQNRNRSDPGVLEERSQLGGIDFLPAFKLRAGVKNGSKTGRTEIIVAAIADT